MRLDKPVDCPCSPMGSCWRPLLPCSRLAKCRRKTLRNRKPKQSLEVVQILQKQILTQRPANPLKRLTRAEYTNTMRDLFGVNFDFTGLLPPDHVEHGFDKYGEVPLDVATSGHGVPQDRTLHRRTRLARCQDLRRGRGNLMCDTFTAAKTLRPEGVEITAMGMTTFSQAFAPTVAICISPSTQRATINLLIPAFGVYRLEVKAHSEEVQRRRDHRAQPSGTGDHPTSFPEVSAGSPCRTASKGFTTELTLKAGDQLAFTFDSARVPGRSLAKKPHDGARHAVFSCEGDRPVDRTVANRRHGWPSFQSRT